MKLRDKQRIVALWKSVLEACDLRYTTTVRIPNEQPKEDKNEHPDRFTQAEVSIYGMHVILYLYPKFFKHSFTERVETFGHEAAHVLLRPMSDAANKLADEYAGPLEDIEERLCDTLTPFVLLKCASAGVDFEPLRVGLKTKKEKPA